MYYGVAVVNVYVSGFSRWIKDPANAKLTFADFLKSQAPYETETELREYLTERGITVISTKITETAGIVERENVKNEAYEVQEQALSWRDRKHTVLKEHEAAQINLLRQDVAAQRRSVFVTADVKLRKAISASGLANLRDSLISPQNLIQLVDLLIGIDVPPASLARLLWSVKMADDKATIKDYLIRRALPHYDAALLLKLGEVLDSYAERIVKDAELENIKLTPAAFEERLATSRFMDRVETEVFSNLATEANKVKQAMKDVGLN